MFFLLASASNARAVMKWSLVASFLDSLARPGELSVAPRSARVRDVAPAVSERLVEYPTSGFDATPGTCSELAPGSHLRVTQSLLLVASWQQLARHKRGLRRDDYGCKIRTCDDAHEWQLYLRVATSMLLLPAPPDRNGRHWVRVPLRRVGLSSVLLKCTRLQAHVPVLVP